VLEPFATIPANPAEALSPYVPSAGAPWDVRHGAHLLRRAGFGGSAEEAAAAVAAGPEAAARALVRAPEDAGLAELDEGLETLLAFEQPMRLRAWWVLRMVRTKAPVREKVGLFLHGHFATGYRKVRSVRAMHRQIRLFLDQGLGSFRSIARAMASDAAMLVFLDGARSERSRPNENFARELMELFTLGRGNYSEADIREAARAFTGWRVDNGAARFRATSFDAKEKTIFGKRGAFNAESAVDLCVDHPACAPFLARKLLQFYCMPQPPDSLVDAFAQKLAASNFELAPVLEALFASRAFYSREAHRSMVKSPVDFAVGALRALGGRVAGASLADWLTAMGQSLFDPPSVKGWDGGPAWIHAATWIARVNFARDATLAGGSMEREIDAVALFAPGDSIEAAARVDRALDVLLLRDVAAPTRELLIDQAKTLGAGEAGLSSLLHRILALPEYHIS